MLGRSRDPRPELVLSWREAMSRDVAGELCDRIVRERPPPLALLRALAAAPLVREKPIRGPGREKKGTASRPPGVAAPVPAKLRPAISVLTGRQRQALTLASHGCEHREAAKILGIDIETLGDHLDNARKALGAISTTQAVAFAIRGGLIA